MPPPCPPHHHCPPEPKTQKKKRRKKQKKQKQNPPKTKQTHSKNNQTIHYPPCQSNQPTQTPLESKTPTHRNPKSNPSKPKRQKLITKNQTTPLESIVPTPISPCRDHANLRHAVTTSISTTS